MRLRRVSSQDRGWRRIRRGRGFEYRDARGRRITDESELTRIRALAVPPAWDDVWLCPRADGHLQATGVDEAGRRQYLYHERWRSRASARKFDRIVELARVLPAARRSVTRDLATAEPTRETVLAAAYRLLDQAQLRVGSERYAHENGSVGLATLECRHVTARDDVVTLRFPGKSGQPWETRLEDAALSAVLRILVQRGPQERLLAWRDDRGWHPLSSRDINADVRRRTSGDFSAKDLRTLRGTATAARSLARIGPKDTATGRRDAIAQAARETADVLGNTPAVARASYIDPRVIDLYEQGVVAPIDRRSIESALLELMASPRS